MAQAKSDYESQLVSNFVNFHNNEIFQYISNIQGQANLPTQMFHNNFQTSNKQEKAHLLLFCIFHRQRYHKSTSTQHDIVVNEWEVQLT